MSCDYRKFVLISLFASLFVISCSKNDNCIVVNNEKYAIAATPNMGKGLSENLVLAFDLIPFEKVLQTYISDNFGELYIIENVSVFVQDYEDGPKTPFLQLSFFNTQQETSENNFYELTEVELSDGTKVFAVGPGDRSIKCISHGRCTQKRDGQTDMYACQPAKDTKSGQLFCTRCTGWSQAVDYTTSFCTHESEVTFRSEIIIELINSL